MVVLRPLYQDPFAPVLFNSVPLVVTDEQKMYVREVLETACSDSKFAQKAYDSIHRILTGGSVKPPIISSLTPNSAEIGDPSFTIHVHGTNFKNTDKIIFAGQEEPTTFVGPTELTTGVNMSVWLGPDVLPVHVQSAEGVLSNPMNFTFTDGSPAMMSAQKTLAGHAVKPPVSPPPVKK